MNIPSLLVTGPCAVVLGETEIPVPGPGEVRVRTRFSCVSPGTELRALSGEQEGRDQWPFIPGYSAVGQIEACGPETPLAEGTWVFHTGTKKARHARVWGAHCARAILPADAVEPLPEGLDPRVAVAAKLGAIALHGTRLSQPGVHESVVVVGLGPIGQLSARCHALGGARVVAFDLSASRVALARDQGVEAHVVSGSLAETVASLVPEGPDIVVDATGSKAALRETIALAREVDWSDPNPRPSRFLLQASYVGDVPIPYLPAFRRELTILVPRADHPIDLRKVLHLAAARKLELADIVTEARPPSDAAAVYDELGSQRDRLMTVAFDWSGL